MFFCSSFDQCLAVDSGRLTWVRRYSSRKSSATQPYKCNAGSFRVSVIHWTLTWAKVSLTCVRDHSHACVYTRGLGTPTESQHIFYSEKLIKFFLCFWRNSNWGRVSVIHWNLTVSLTCVRDHSHACVYTQGLGTPTESQHIFYSEKLITFFLCFWRDSNGGHGMWRPTLYPLSHPATRSSFFLDRN